MDTVAHCVNIRWQWNYTFVASQINGLRHFRPIVLTLMEDNPDAYPGVPLYAPYSSTLPFLRRRWAGLVWRFFDRSRPFRRVIKKERVKLIHAHFGYNGVHCLPLKERFDLPLVTSFHGHDAYLLPDRYPEKYKELFQKGDVFLVVSQYMKDILEQKGCPPEKILVHHVGVDVEFFKPRLQGRRSDKTTFLTVSWFTPQKGFPYLLRAFAQARENCRDIQLRIVGDVARWNPDSQGVYEEMLELIESLHLSDSVELVGYKSGLELAQEYKAADVFVLPSFVVRDGNNRGYREGIPTVIMEAQACGLPVISTWHTGIPECVIDGKSGYLMPERDVDGLAERMCFLARNPSLWAQMGRMGREHVIAEFNSASQNEKLERLYQELIG